jgi:hypothetical protein
LPDEKPQESPSEDLEKGSCARLKVSCPFVAFWNRFSHKRWFQALLIFSLLWIIYNSNARLIGGSDCYAARFCPINLVLYKSYHYDKLTFLRGADGKGGMPGGMLLTGAKTPSDGHVITFYPVLIPTLLAPFYYIIFGIFKISPKSFWPFYMDKWFMAAFVAGAAAFLFSALARIRIKFRARLLLTITFALGTSAWAICSQAFWQHGPSQFFLALSLYLLLRLKESDDWIGPIGLVTSLALGARQTNLIWYCLVGLYILYYLIREKRKWWNIIWYFVWSVPVVLFTFWYNWTYFGSPLTSGYDFNPVNRYIADFLHIHNFPAGFRGLLFSTSLGLFPNAPFFLFLIPAFFLGRKKYNHPELAIRRIMWIFIVYHILLYSCYREWWGGYSYAYRYLTDIMPFMCFLLFPLVSWKIFRKGLFAVFLVFLLWAMLIQFYGAFLWSGTPWYGTHWKNLTQQLLLNKEALKKGQLFGKHSVHWSLKKEDHYIGMEMKYFRFSWTWFQTPRKIWRDLNPKREVTYGEYSPIILILGDPNVK